MGKAIDITNQRFDKLLVLKRSGISKDNRAVWLCQCDCGNQIEVTGSDLRRGRKKDCGCVLLAKKIRLQNQKFGFLTALFPTEKRDSNGAVMWHCQCDCGNECDVASSKLVSGNTTSCGCKRTQSLINYNHERKKDLTNQKFGKLIALYPNGSNNNGNIIWHCKCDCGNECDINSHDLINGNTKSCGCNQHNSYGEQKIEQILKENNIAYKKEKTFSTCIFPDTQKLARFDFYLPNYNILIEYDGIQHFIIGNGQYDNFEKFKTTQQHDQFKNQWCEDNNITLIRIPYTKYNTLTINDLIS